MAPANDRTRAVMRFVLAAFYIVAGIAHLRVPDKLLAITPAWVPFATQLILITGVCEIAGAVALVTKPLRSRSMRLRMAGQHQACPGGHRPSTHPQQLALSRAAAGAAAGLDLVGSVLRWRDRLALAA